MGLEGVRMTRKLHVLQGLLFTSALFAAQSAVAQVVTQPSAPDQEPAAETAAEGDAKVAGSWSGAEG